MRLIPWQTAPVPVDIVSDGLRPMDVRRDLIGVTELVGLAFKEELRNAGRNPKEELWIVRRSMPFVWLLATLSPRFRDAFLGYVWMERGRVVGNVSLTRLDRSSRHWMIGNVAVNPEYRRRGIARRLTQRAIWHCEAHGANRVSLEVRRGNVAAQALYESMGFQQTDCHTKFELSNVPNVVPGVVIGVSLRPIRPHDYAQVRRLRISAERRGPAPMAPAPKTVSFLDWWEYLADAVNGSAALSWVAERDGIVLGYVSVSAGPSSIRHLRYYVHSLGRGLVESALTGAALRHLHGRRLRVRVEVQSDYEDLVAALQSYGFEPLETLDRMTLDLEHAR